MPVYFAAASDRGLAAITSTFTASTNIVASKDIHLELKVELHLNSYKVCGNCRNHPAKLCRTVR